MKPFAMSLAVMGLSVLWGYAVGLVVDGALAIAVSFVGGLVIGRIGFGRIFRSRGA